MHTENRKERPLGLKYRTARIGKGVLRWVVLAAFVFPVLWTIAASFKSEKDLFAYPPKIFFSPTIDGYKQVLTLTPILTYILNSVIVCTVALVIGMVIGTAAAYVLSRVRMRRSRDISFWILSTRMAPPIVMAVPFFLLSRRLHIYDTRLLLVVIYLAINLPFIVWSMRSYLDQIPVELDEAAMVDGLSRSAILWKIIVPVSLPGLWATAILTFIFEWNEFLFAFLLTGNRAKTVPVAMAAFVTQEGMRWNQMLAAATLVLTPILIFVAFAHRYLVRGLIEGAVKG
jgi:multiple sugar transport system permease protein